jgi:MtN3 and saliva related transmembrane protein
MTDLDWQTTLGLVAGFLTTVAFVPQVVKTWRTRSAEDVSLRMFVAFLTGVGLWLIYGIIRSDIAMVAANGVTFLLAGLILFFKVRYG